MDNPRCKNSDSSRTEEIVVQCDIEIKELIGTYLNNKRKNIASIQEALSSGDFKTIQRIGHGLKGSGTSYGFKLISQLGAAIEEAAKKNNSKEIKNQVGNFEDFLCRVRVEYVD